MDMTDRYGTISLLRIYFQISSDERTRSDQMISKIGRNNCLTNVNGFDMC